MGVGGHMLGPKKLRRLARLTGLPLERAYIRNGDAQGRTIEDGHCVHWAIDPYSGAYERISSPRTHWTSCPREP